MAEYLTVKGQSYSVTANSNTTVTDATGLSLSVEAGGQAQFIACADKVEVEGDCSIVQCRLSSVGSSTRSGGGGVDPSNFVSKDEFAEFQESNEQALEAKQDMLATGEGLSIVDNTIYATYVEDARGYATDAAAAQAAAASAQSAAAASATAAGEAATAAGASADAAAASAEEALSILGNTLQADKENTFTAAQTFHAPVTVGTPRVAAVWAKVAVSITDANMRKAGTITDNAGRTLELAADSSRTQDGFAKTIGNSELGLTVTHISTTYTLYDSSSPAGQEGTIGNTRKLYLDGFGYSSRQTLSLSGGKDGVAEVGQPVMLNGNVYIGHGPEGVKARCYFGITAAYLAKAGTITDNNPNHPLAIELPANSARTIDSCIAEINAQGYKLEVKAIKYNATNIYLESTVAGSAPNGIVFTRKGCFSTYSDGSAQTTTQGSNIQGLDEGAASEWELRQNGYPVASRQTNNVYEGVQVFNNAVALNGLTALNAAVQVSGAVGGIGLARAAFDASPVFTATENERMLYEPMLTGRPHVCLYAPSLNIKSSMKPDLDSSIPGDNDQAGYGYNWYRQAETLDLHVGSITAVISLRSKAWFIRLHMNNPLGNNHSLFRSDYCHPNLRVLHLSTSGSSFGASVYSFKENLTRLEEFVLSGPVATSVHPANSAAFPGARHLRSARIYLPKLASSTTLLKDSPLDKDSLLFLMRWLPVPTSTTLTFTIGMDAAMPEEDQAEVTAKAESLLNPDTGFGWNMVLNPATYA